MPTAKSRPSFPSTGWKPKNSMPKDPWFSSSTVFNFLEFPRARQATRHQASSLKTDASRQPMFFSISAEGGLSLNPKAKKNPPFSLISAKISPAGRSKPPTARTAPKNQKQKWKMWLPRNRTNRQSPSPVPQRRFSQNPRTTESRDEGRSGGFIKRLINGAGKSRWHQIPDKIKGCLKNALRFHFSL